jgi:hypothetical protein
MRFENSKTIIVCLAIVLCFAVFGCATLHYSDGDADSDVKLPIRFKNYRELYGFISREVLEEASGNKSMASNPDTIFKLAADSETETYALDNPPFYLWVIMPHYLNGGINDQIRGTQGNGVYFIVRPLAKNFTSENTDCGFELVGITSGNALKFSSYNQTTRLITYWHISATDHPETTYEWNGKKFERLK